MSYAEEARKTAKNQRRAAKASLTRLGKALEHVIDQKRPANEVSDYLVKVKDAFDNVVVKHELYANMLDDDEQSETEEEWLDECQNYFLRLDIDSKSYNENVSNELNKALAAQKSHNSLRNDRNARRK